MELIKVRVPMACELIALLLTMAMPLFAGGHLSDISKSSVIRTAPTAPAFDEKTRLAELAGQDGRRGHQKLS